MPSRSGRPTAPAQAPGDAGRRDRHAQPDALGRLAAAERLDALADGGVGRDGQDQAAVGADRVDPEQPAGAGRSAARPTSRGAAARCARSRSRSGAGAGRGSCARVEDTKPGVTRSPRPPGLARASTARPIGSDSTSSSVHWSGSIPAVSASITARSRSGVRGQHPTGLAPAVVEGHGHLVAAEVVGVGEDPARVDHEPGAPAPSLPEPDHRRAVALRGGLDRALELF